MRNQFFTKPFTAVLQVIIVNVVLLFLNCSSGKDTTSMSKEAFYSIERDPFKSSVVKQAEITLRYTQMLEPKNTWVNIALSRLYLEKGYIAGDRSRRSTYNTKNFEKAKRFAWNGLIHGDNESMAFVNWARFQIIMKDNKGAWETLNRGYVLDTNGFYPWYYKSVLSLKMRDPDRSENYINEARIRAKEAYQYNWVISRKIDIANLRGDSLAEESAYKEMIANDPKSSHAYGNYALYLKKHKRYDEAIQYYNEALKIAPYRRAAEQLIETNQLKKYKMK